jgi:NEDD8-activating enzyme E1 regulatory subunit
MKASTTSYIHLQKMYKKRAEEEKEIFKSYLKVDVNDAVVDSFVKNSHAVRVMRGRQWGKLETSALGEFFSKKKKGFPLFIPLFTAGI